MNIKYAKKVLHQPWNVLNLQRLLSLHVKLCLFCKFILPEAMVIDLFAILQVFLVGLGN